MPASMVTALIGLADDHLILGHRLSEWCGHAPMLEEDLAMPNIALDLIGQARALYSYAGELEGAGRDEDALAFGRLERAYRNLLICELPNGDFAQTMLRQFYFASFMQLFWQAAEQSADATLSAIAAKAVKEAEYHRRHCAQWVIRLGDGTDESARRMTEAAAAMSSTRSPRILNAIRNAEIRTGDTSPSMISLKISRIVAGVGMSPPIRSFNAVFIMSGLIVSGIIHLSGSCYAAELYVARPAFARNPRYI